MKMECTDIILSFKDMFEVPQIWFKICGGHQGEAEGPNFGSKPRGP